LKINDIRSRSACASYILGAKHGEVMNRKAPLIAADLQQLLDERDDLRIKISLTEDQPGFAQDVMMMRHRVVELDRAIISHRATPDA
jgi:hypothetical protein